MTHDRVLQVDRADPLAARLHDVLRAVDQLDVAVGGDDGDVARLEPTVLGERLGRALVVVVAGRDPRTGDLQLAAALTVPRLLVGGARADDPEVDADGDLADGRAQVRLALLVQGRVERAL